MLELVVCLGLLSLMTGLVAAGLALAARGQGIVEDAERADSARAVQDHLRRVVEGALPVFMAEDGGAASIRFSGEQDRLRLVSRSDRYLEGGGLAVVDFAVEEIAGGKSLVTHRRRLGSRPVESDAGTRFVLADGISQIEFRYFGSRGVGEAPDWGDEWHHSSALPLMVEISITSNEENSLCPPLVVNVLAASGPTS